MAKPSGKKVVALLERMLMERAPSNESVGRLFDALVESLSQKELEDIDRRRANMVGGVQKAIKRSRAKRSPSIFVADASWQQGAMVARSNAPKRRRQK